MSIEFNLSQKTHFIQRYTKTMSILLPASSAFIITLSDKPLYAAIILAIFLLYNIIFTRLDKLYQKSFLITIRRFLHVPILFLLPYVSGPQTPGWLISLGLIHIVTITENNRFIQYSYIFILFLATMLGMYVSGNDVDALLISSIAIATTITMSLTTKTLLNEAYLNQKKANTDKDMILSVISHDFRTPLNNIESLLPLLKNDEYDISKQNKDEMIDTLLAQTGKVQSLLTNVLTWSKAKRGLINPKKEQLSAHLLIQESIAAYELTIAEKEITATLEIPENNSVFCDSASIRIVFANIIQNAIKYTPRGGTIAISTSQNSEELTVLFRITNSGKAVDSTIVNNLFKTTQVTSTLGTENESGNGLGLSLSKELVEENNGTIYYDNSYSEGTSFVVKLPTES
ncbi:MAG: HAMP domain-containing histidine kinase [Fibrobacterales bacterium]